jgi:hypothetical protein
MKLNLCFCSLIRDIEIPLLILEISNNVGQYKLHNTPDRLLLTTVPLVRTTLTKVLIVIFSLISMLSILLYFNCWGRILFMKFNTEFSKLWVDFQIVLCRLDTRHFYKLQITMANSFEFMFLFPDRGYRNTSTHFATRGPFVGNKEFAIVICNL